MFHLVSCCQCLPGSPNFRTREVGIKCHKAIYIVFITLKMLAFSFLPVYSGIKYRSKEALAMNNSERIGMSAIMVVALILLLASLASAQGILDGKWFSVKVKTTTLWWQSTTIPIQKRTDSFSAYMQFVWKSQNLGIQQYDCAIWTQDITGTWQNRWTSSWYVYNEDDTLSLVPDFNDSDAVWYVGDNRHTTDANFLVKIATDATGAFKKATFNSMGCNVGTALPGGGDATGGCTIKGKSLNQAPF
jgi:hypothetical protein